MTRSLILFYFGTILAPLLTKQNCPQDMCQASLALVREKTSIALRCAPT